MRLASLMMLCLLVVATQATTSLAAEPNAVPLCVAVKDFNDRAARDEIGQEQAPLTEEEVVAAIRWAIVTRDKLPVSDKTCQTLARITESRELPQGFELEVLTGFAPNDQVYFSAWSVRLRVPREPMGTYAISIRERWISSRLVGEEERMVIREHDKKMRERGGIVLGQEDEYWRERKRAADFDRSKQK
jgi:hypothetical protein